ALLLGLLAMWGFGSFTLTSLKNLSVVAIKQLNDFRAEPSIIQFFLGDLFTRFALIISPFLVATAAAGILTNFLQVGPLFSFEVLAFRPEKLNPFNGIKQLFSRNALVETIKAILKLAAVAAIVYITIQGESVYFQSLGSKDINGILNYIAFLTFDVAFRVALFLLLLGILDLFYQRWSYNEKLKMTLQEVKDENKQTEGSPEVRRIIQERQLTMTQRRMMDEIPDADVVITNPRHIAVAIKYDRDVSSSPVVIAKGADLIAKRIREIAEENEIPIMEDKPVAWALFELELGDIIPVELYKPVAQILARVYSMKQSFNKAESMSA
ncbi:uncharacterized protein METZ01_LOCUS274987, partial [marine metagenome]